MMMIKNLTWTQRLALGWYGAGRWPANPQSVPLTWNYGLRDVWYNEVPSPGMACFL